MPLNNSFIPFHHFPRDKQPSLTAANMMLHVCYALIPGIILQTVFFGGGVLVHILFALLTAVVCEWANAKLRKRLLNRLDLLTGCVTALLLAVSIPAVAPWWLIVIGVASGLLLGKHVFGGVGMNIFNPAMVGFCIIYLSYPALISLWPLGYVPVEESLSTIFTNNSIDARVGATVLASLKANGLFEGTIMPSVWINIAWLLGGVYLWRRHIADWRLSLVFFVSFFLLTLVFALFRQTTINIWQHIGFGSLIFTACFIITDPTTAASSSLGRIVYALLAAVVAVLIRQFSNMPDSMAFAVLFANMCVPMIDSYTRPAYVK